MRNMFYDVCSISLFVYLVYDLFSDILNDSMNNGRGNGEYV
jgi:hypothetical protein